MATKTPQPHAVSPRETTPETRSTWARLRNHPLFLIAALVIGVALMFGAPLLAQNQGQSHDGHDHDGEVHGEAHGAETGHADEHGDGHGEAHGDEHHEGVEHPPTLVSILANAIERATFKPKSPGDKFKNLHYPTDAKNPVAGAVLRYQAPIFSFLLIALLAFLFIRSTRNMTMVPGRLQNLVEMVVEALDGMVRGVIGPEGRRFVPFLGTLFLYIYAQNVFGLFPLMFTPTSVLESTVAMAIVVFVYVQWTAFTVQGPVGYLRHLAGDPKDAVGWGMAPLMLPLHVVGEIAKPVSLSLRLFGNMLGEETLIAVFMGLGVTILAFTHLPVGVPLHVPFMFLGLLTTLIQALVFTLLSTIYFSLALPHHEEH